jgi:SOUL heme-binding protein
MTIATRIAAAAAGLIGAVPGVANAIEQPAYTVVAEHPGWELRRYSPFLEARVTVNGPWDAAVSNGFRVLAGYIFGGNQPNAAIAMTAPVTAQREGQKIAMTAPVAAQRTGTNDGSEAWTVAFSMPSQWTLDTLPAPDDSRISLMEVAGHDAAVIGFGMWATTGLVAAKTDELLASLRAAGLEPVGEPVVAQYNPPWTPPPFRKNEVIVRVQPRG